MTLSRKGDIYIDRSRGMSKGLVSLLVYEYPKNTHLIALGFDLYYLGPRNCVRRTQSNTFGGTVKSVEDCNVVKQLEWER